MTLKRKDSWKSLWCSTDISPGYLKFILPLVESTSRCQPDLLKWCPKMPYISALKALEEPLMGLSMMKYMPHVPCNTILDLVELLKAWLAP